MRHFLLAAAVSISLCWFAAVAVADESTGEEKPAVKRVAVVTLQGSLPESSGATGLFGQTRAGLADVLARLKRAGQDEEIAAVVVRIRDLSAGRGKLHELRTTIAGVRATGKRVVAEFESASSADYLVACACDEITMPESGVVMIPGVRAEVTFYKGLLDKLGIEAEMMQVGDFKGTAEPYTRDAMSPQFRAHYESLLDDVFDQMVATIAAARNLQPDRVKTLIDQGLFTAAAAKRAGLIDHVAYADALPDRLAETLEVDTVEMIANYGKKKVDNDFSGMLGMMKLFEMMMGGKPDKSRSSRPKLALIRAQGTIVSGKSTVDFLSGQAMGSETIVKAIRRAEADESVAAIVLRIDSPGGSSLASDLIWRAVQKCEKPVIASMGDVAASGGYYIAMGCDSIYAEPGTVTGSIGVVGGKLAIDGLMRKVGVTTEVISRGKNSGLLSMGAPFTASERAAFKENMETVYRQFVTKAAEGRGVPTEAIEKLAGGRVWTGRQAEQNGLVDHVGTLADAVAAAKKAAGLEAGEQLDLLELPRPTNIIDQLLGLDTDVQLRTPTASSWLPGEWSKAVRQAEQLRELFAEPAVLIMPYAVEIR